MKLITVLVFIACNYLVSGDYDKPVPPFPKLTDSPSFHSRSVVRNGAKTTYNEEYVDLKNGRSRWDIAENGREIMDFVSDETDQVRSFRTQTDNTDCVVRDIDTTADESGIDFSLSDYDKDSKPKTLVGPTAIWRKVVRLATEKRAEVYYKDTEVVRGITCDKWSIALSKDDFEGFVTLYFANPNWKKFENINITIPVTMLIEGKKTKNKVARRVEIKIDYNIFEPYPESWRQVIPIQGVGCKKVKNPPGFVFPGQQPDGASRSFHASLEIIRATNVYSYEFFQDLDSNVARFEYVTAVKKKIKLIQDLERAVLFDIDSDGKCDVSHLDSMIAYSEAEAYSMQRLAQRILQYVGDFYYLGAADERGVLCVIWEQVYDDPAAISQLTKEFDGLLPKTLNKLVLSYYFHDQQSESSPKYILMAVKARGYKSRPRKNMRPKYYTEEFSMDFEFFNLHNLYEEETFNDVFGVSECYIDPELKKSFELYVETDVDDKLSKTLNQLMQESLFSFAKVAQIGALRIPKVDVDYNSKGFVLTVQVVEKLPASLSFHQVTSDGSARLTVADKKVEATDIDDCAQKAIDDDKAKIFLYCAGDCYVSSRLPTDKAAIVDNAKLCDLFYKDSPLGDTVDLSIENDLQAVEEALREAVKAKKLRIGGYIVKDMAVATPAASQTNQGKDFRLSIGQHRIRNTSETSVTGDSDFIDSVADCYQLCRDEDSISCSSFSLCHNQETDAMECVMSSLALTSETSAKTLADTTESDDSCSIYVRDYLQIFDKYLGQVSLLTTDDKAITSSEKSTEICASKCTHHDDFDCQSFQYCPDTKQCSMRSDHFLQAVAVENFQNKVSNTSRDVMCDYYTLKHIQNFFESGTDLVDEKYALMSKIYTTVEACAATCANEPSCKSFGFCPRTADESPKCTLTTASALDPDIDTTSQPLCRNYEKKYDNKMRAIENAADSTSGLSGSGLFWLFFLLFLLGVSMGASGYVAWGYFHAPKKDNSDAEANGSTSFFGHRDKDNDNNLENFDIINNPDL
ncbi:hypothetical protein HDE_01728 [Halotydeus destructor]|nr:hypothetical protein HDE_01728 [Halotydeus destructor]